ncbi:hypothetical protein [Deefgea piscis]|uniref:hypothetical protein n=1 Tax=Deefgea piscis TaxID=2739061 RepID=UPI001C7E5973|nr:hypothetical protein [Deefgea piscis]QZA81468.1 hypothetical protein K4H25_02015 [Deefgea piscis]
MPEIDLFAILNILLVIALLPLVVWATLAGLRLALRGCKARSVFKIMLHDDFGARLERWCQAHDYTARRTPAGEILLQQNMLNPLSPTPQLRICHQEYHWQIEAWIDFFVPKAACEIAPDTSNLLGKQICKSFKVELNLLLQLLEHPEMP